MHDVLVVGGGPAGAIAGLVAARAGARVRILERATFPRDKLCGDTINPGAFALLRRLGAAAEIEMRALAVAGMIVSGEGGARITGRYPAGVRGGAILRRDLDAILIRTAVRAGCDLDEGVAVRRCTVVDRRGDPVVAGVTVGSREGERTLRAPIVIAADGRRSAVAFGLGLARHPARPRRWAVGAYFAGAPEPISSSSSDGGGVLGEMHVRKNCYVGVAPVPGGLTNVCLVRPATAGRADFRRPEDLIRRTIESDPMLRDRMGSATLVAPPVVLGPLAVDSTGLTFEGLLVAGDAAGFIDPMTGDGLRFAIRGGELAGLAALRALEHGWDGVHAELRAARRRAFAPKWRFNCTLRALVASPAAIAISAAGSRLLPAVLQAVIARAGDCDLAA